MFTCTDSNCQQCTQNAFKDNDCISIGSGSFEPPKSAKVREGNSHSAALQLSSGA